MARRTPSRRRGERNKVLTVTPGTDRCADPTTPFSISAIFSPGAYFAAALGDFKAGKLEMGKARVFHVGVDPVPDREDVR